MRTAESELKRLHRLMNNLLNATRLQAGAWSIKVEPCDLSDVAAAALEELGTPEAEPQILTEIPLDLPMFPMDFALIVQVLVNLIGNALKFSPANQPIYLRGRLVAGNLEITVADQGIGIPERDLERVFHKFYRLSEMGSVDGLGLGLSICREFVVAHRGRISLEHNPAGGTIAKVVLPGAPL